ncbi:hypothetical protein EC915_106214 [Pseudomonas sp. LP_7_YM]|nr:hypothetical protein EC915_106214 [Pseudomonas sp. LP_7_YM]
MLLGVVAPPALAPHPSRAPCRPYRRVGKAKAGSGLKTDSTPVGAAGAVRQWRRRWIRTQMPVRHAGFAAVVASGPPRILRTTRSCAESRIAVAFLMCQPRQHPTRTRYARVATQERFAPRCCTPLIASLLIHSCAMKLARSDRHLIAWMLYCCVLFNAFARSIGHGQMVGMQLNGSGGEYCSTDGAR